MSRGVGRVGGARCVRVAGRRPSNTSGQSAARVVLATTALVGREPTVVPRSHQGGARARYLGAGHPSAYTGGNRHPALGSPPAVFPRRGASTAWRRVERGTRGGAIAPSAGGLLVLWPPGTLGVGVPRAVSRGAGPRTRAARGSRGTPQRAGTSAAVIPAPERRTAGSTGTAGRRQQWDRPAGHGSFRPRRGDG